MSETTWELDPDLSGTFGEAKVDAGRDPLLPVPGLDAGNR